MDYPAFMAKGWPIASGLAEAGCKSVVCQRTKGFGMRSRRLGAQAILNLRCRRRPAVYTLGATPAGPLRSEIGFLRLSGDCSRAVVGTHGPTVSGIAPGLDFTMLQSTNGAPESEGGER